MTVLLIILSYLIVLFILNLFGFAINKKQKINYKDVDYDVPVYGFSLIIVIVNILYFCLEISLTSIVYIVLAFSILFLLYLIKINLFKKLFNSFIIYSLIGIPIFLFLIFFYSLYGENLIIFRGNQWDYFHYLKQSLIVLNNNYEYLSKNPDQLYFNEKYLHDRPVTYLNIAFVKVISNLDIIKSGFLYKCICISLTANGFVTILKNHKNKIILSILFPFSFWVFYVYEIDALAQIASIPITLVLTSLILEFFISGKKIDNQNIFKISIISAATFLIYAESFFIYLFAFIIAFIIKQNSFFLFYKKINKSHFKIFFLFIILTIAGYGATYGSIFNKIFSNISGDVNVNYWGYYGGFILGKKSVILDNHIIDHLKKITENGYQCNIITEIIKINYLNGYSLFFFNIIPSIFGLFVITINELHNTLTFYLSLLFIIFANIIIIIFIIRLKKCIKKINKDYQILLKAILITFTLLFILFLFKRSFWQIIKLYFYFSPFLYFLIILNKNKINYFLIAIICLTPIYQYSENNDGIGKRNSFPSIINSDYKNKFDWNLDVAQIVNCDSIKIQIDTSRYNVQKYNYAAIKVFDGQKKDLQNKNKECIITENGNKFLITKN
jgi:hypothetical protein